MKQGPPSRGKPGVYARPVDAERAVRRMDRAVRRAGRLGISTPLPAHIPLNAAKANLQLERAREQMRRIEEEERRRAEKAARDAVNDGAPVKPKRSHKKKVVTEPSAPTEAVAPAKPKRIRAKKEA